MRPRVGMAMCKCDGGRLRTQNFLQNAGAFLKKHCFDCHGADTQEARLRYDQLTAYQQPADRHLWTIVHEQVSSEAMPAARTPAAE